MLTKKQYPVGNHILTFVNDENETNVAKLPDNNLYIEGIWNMKDTLKFDDLCTGCWVIDDETFNFTVFSGGNFTMKIHDNTVELISRRFVK